MTLSLAPFNIWPLAMLSILGFHLCLTDASPKQAVWRSSYYALGLLLTGLYWLYVSMHYHGGASVFLACLMTSGLCLFLASWFMPFAYLYSKYIIKFNGGTTLGFAAIWVVLEWLRTWLLTGFPWLFAGYSQLEGPLHAWAPVVGTLGISFFLAYTTATLSQTVLTRKPSRHMFVVIIIWLAPLYLHTLVWTEKKRTEPYNVGILQPNTDLEDKFDPAFRFPIMHYLQDTTESLKGQDIVVWPETALPQTYDRNLDFLDDIDQFGQANNMAIILGVASRWHKEDNVVYHNSVLALGKSSGMYHKQKLVPFGEFIPLENLLRGIIDFFDLPMSAFRPGPANQPAFQVHDLLIMPYICYEIVYPEFVAQTAGQSDILLTISNDAWFGTSIGPLQHLQIAQMRALENGRYIIRGTNNGATVVINENGDITASLPQFTEGVLKAQVYALKGLTPVARYGTLPAVIFSILLLIFLFLDNSRNPVTNRK